jgi:putative drug exporter of the RND superfamily
MPDFFRRLASLPCGRRGKWVVLVAWIIILAAAAPLASKLTGAQENDAAAWLPSNAESTQVVELSEKWVSPDVYPALIVYDRNGAAVTPADLEKAKADAQRFNIITDADSKRIVTRVTGPIPARDGQALQTIVELKLDDEGWNSLPAAVEEMRKISQNGGADLRAHVTGPAGYGADFAEIFAGFDATLLYITAAIVIIILLITYRSPVLWLLPIICVGFALFSAQALIYLLTHVGLTVNGQSAFILTVLVFGAGTDYALLLIARYREELRRHEDRHEAMAIALHRAGPAIIASGATVSLGMLCLLAAQLNSTKGMGPIMAIGVAVGLLAMVTALPALLVIFGRWVFWPKRPSFGSAEPTTTGIWARLGNRISRRPRLTWVVTALVLGTMAFGLTSLNPQYLSSQDSFSFGNEPESVAGEQILGKHFPAGSGSPLQIIGNAAQKQQLITALSGVQGLSDVKSPYPDRDGLAYIEGTLNARPDSPQGFDLLERTRDVAHAVPGADAKVGGGTAVAHDIQEASARDNRVIVPLVLAVVFVILALLLRAIVAPVLLLATVVLSFGAALGMSALVFEHVFDFAGTDVSFPLWVFVFLVALGVDYNIFLMGRVHEEAKQHGTRRGALIGLSATGGVITSAGAVLAGTFAALGSLPLVFVTELGFAVAFGVLLDTFIVRSVLVTALTLDLGPRIWWPSRLAKETEAGVPAHPKYAPPEETAETAGASR